MASLFTALPASAQDATWLNAPGSNDFHTATNWSPATVPNGTGTAFFGTSATTALTFSANKTLGGLTFNAGASNYTFDITGFKQVYLTGAGIVINGGSATITTNPGGSLNFLFASTAGNATLANNSGLNFSNSSTAGTATIANSISGNLNFSNTSTAGTATITNDGSVGFNDTSTAGSATITNNGGGTQYFFGTSTAGSATITNNGGGSLIFNASSTAGSATITNNNGSTVNFNGTSTAGSATITNNDTSTVNFNDTSTAGNAAITTKDGSTVNFNDNSTAGSATFAVNDFSTLAFKNSATAGSATIVNNYVLDFSGASTAGNAAIVSNDSFYFRNASTAGSATITNNSTLTFSDTSTAGSATITNNFGGSGLSFFNTSTAGSATITNSGTLIFYATSTAGSATIANNGGAVEFHDNSTAGSAAITNDASGTTDFSYSTGPLGDNKLSAGSINGGGNFRLGQNELTVGGNNLSTNVTGVIADGGGGGGAGASLVKTGTGTMTLSGVNTYTGGTTLAGGAISVSSDANLGGAAGGLTFNGGALQVTGTTFNATARTITWGAGGGTFDIAAAANNFTVGQTLNGGQLTKSGTGTLTLSAANTFTGGVTMNGGTLNLGAMTQTTGALTLNGGTIANGTVTGTAFNTQNGTISAVLAGSGALTQSGAGTTTLSGTNTYTGATTVNGGVLAVNGSILASSGVTVNAGGTLTGTGTVGNILTSGGVFMAGNGTAGSSMNVTGTLGFNAASTFAVNVNPTTSSFATVSGAATLGGATVDAIFANGSYIAKKYTILTAGSISGTFGAVNNTNLPSNFHDSMSYDATHAYLNLDLNFTTPAFGTLSGNQNNVANALITYFNATGGIPLTFATLSAPALSQASGQPGASTAQTGFAGTGQFVNGVFDGAFGDGPGQGGALGFAQYDDEASAYTAKPKVSREARDAYAAVTPRDRRTPAFEARWNVWASVYGGNSRVNGDSSVGTNTTTSRNFGTIAGASYRFTPDTLAGFALGGAGSSFDVAGGFGGGKADIFNAAVYAKHNIGAAYVAGLLGYSWQDTTTDRTVTISGNDKLHASFKAQALAARLEGGWRYATPAVGITPYAALQATTFYLPAYGETATSGSNTFALNYASKTATATRGELGAKFDKAMPVHGGMFTLKAKTAWAHDWNTDRSATATFQSLPGATFTTNGAQPSANAALLSLGGEMRWDNGWALAGSFDGEFSRNTAGYAGKGSLRYAW